MFVLLIGAASLFLIVINDQQTPNKASTSNAFETPVSDHEIEKLIINEDDGTSFSLLIKDIPLYRSYLDAQTDRTAEIERTQYTVLDISKQTKYVLLQYSCGNKQCSTILVKISDSNISSIALANGIFQDFKVSLDKGRVLLRYGYNEGSQVVRHILIAVDLEQLKVIPYQSDQMAKVYMLTPTWPLHEYHWIDNNQFIIKTPDLKSSEFESIKKWFSSSEQKTKDVSISLSENNLLNSYPIT